MPSPESNRRNLEYARNIGRSKFWRSAGESQRVKAEILQAYFAVPRPSQRAIAQRLHVSQPYVAKLIRKIKRVGPEMAVGPEAYQHFTALRDAELRQRNQSLAAKWQSSLGGTTQPKEWHSQGNSGSGGRTDARPTQVEGQTQCVELVRSTSGEIFELYDSSPRQPASPRSQILPALTVAQRVGVPVIDQIPSFGRR